jgi:hypothetical protein
MRQIKSCGSQSNNCLRETCSLNKALRGFDNLSWAHLQLSAKHPIPEAARDTETILIIGKVVLKVVLLEFLVVCGQPVEVSDLSLKACVQSTYFWWCRK